MLGEGAGACAAAGDDTKTTMATTTEVRRIKGRPPVSFRSTTVAGARPEATNLWPQLPNCHPAFAEHEKMAGILATEGSKQ
jgi:hypothetical protein